MSGITLFTDSRFPCPQRVHLVLVELGITVKETRELDILKHEHKTPELLKLNPFGAVPFMKDDAHDPPLVLCESRAIARYLAQRYGDKSPGKPSLIPCAGDSLGWAVFEEAASIELTAFDAAANPVVLEKYFKPEVFHRDPDEEKCKVLRGRLAQVLDILNMKLTRHKFMAGNTLTLVDLFYLPYMHHLEYHVWPSFLHGRPHLAAWWKVMKGRDSYRAVLGVE